MVEVVDDSLCPECSHVLDDHVAYCPEYEDGTQCYCTNRDLRDLDLAGFVKCPLCGDPERKEDIVGGVCLTCADAIAFAQNARRASIVADPDPYMCPNCVTPWKCNGPHITNEAAAGPRDDTEPCPTCMQPVPVPQRGDHDYGLPLRAGPTEAEAAAGPRDDALTRLIKRGTQPEVTYGPPEAADD